jgi:nitrite reductase/ring-hydroxylating ferredoxin subunit
VEPEEEGALTRAALTGVVAVIVAALGLIGIVYLLPPEYLRLGNLEPVVRVAPEAEFTVGTSRRITWGDRSVLVVRRSAEAYHAVQGTSPSDGCYLRWQEEALHVVSPCTYGVYDLQGHVVEGLTTEPLRQYRVFTRDAVVYVTELHGDG